MKKVILLSFIVSSMIYANGIETNSKGIELKKSVISTSGFESTTRNTVKNVMIISKEEIENRSYNNVAEILRDVAGVTVYKNRFGSFIDLRGQGEVKAKSNVQVLVDGVNLNPLDPGHGVLALNSIPVADIDRIEILPGGGSVIYGDGTVGGVINIITKLKGNKIYNQVGVTAGSYGKFNYNIALGHNFNDTLGVQIAYNGDKTDGYRKGNKDRNEYFETAFNYKLNKDNNIMVKYSRYENKNYSLSGLTQKEVEENRRQQGDSKPDKSELVKDSYNLNYNGKISDKVAFGLDTSYQRVKNLLGNKENGLFRDKKLQVSPKLKFDYLEDSELVVGVDYKKHEAQREALKPGFLSIYKSYNYKMEKNMLAGYAFNKVKVKDFEFVQGVRVEKAKFDSNRNSSFLPFIPSRPVSFNFDKDMKNTAYELGVNYLYSDTGNIYTRFENGFRTPAPTEFTNKLMRRGYTENNLSPETYKTFEFGIKDSLENSYVALTLFHTETVNEITLVGRVPYWWEYKNIGKTRRIGAELQMKQEFGNLVLSEDFTYIQPKIVKSNNGSNGKYIPTVSKYAANLSVQYKFSDKLSTTLATTYKSGYYINEQNTNGKYNSRVVSDIVVNYRLDNGVKLYAGINNIFDKKYYESVVEDRGQISYDPAAGRNYFVGFNYSF